MHQGERLKTLIDSSGKTRSELASVTGISEASIYNYQNEELINSKKLKKLAAALGVDMTEFQEQGGVNEARAIYQLREKIKTLEQMVKDKEVIILSQQEVIDLLKEQKQKR